ncbi:hypothetical protein ARMA_0777 [Ardenticatena maritima]|uniref:PD-(D/E)XK endonuclease-like domain-containing protein n=1 Tax=Ardenticatena maritima TaxID=872965 RepID=A0A0M9UBY6_9CHLR|nr:hypothetical protein [Ardenticatena maritima]KPL87179.1 hypothetical protein SE16_11635 [Ardenticatena maritima]GAP62354.1 hypothetical protein ARMA_0777 [Ardenticatena maritima]
MKARYTRASELNEFAYCRRAWYLRHVRGYTSANQTELAEGENAHRQHGRRLHLALWAWRLGLLLMLAGLLLWWW